MTLEDMNSIVDRVMSSIMNGVGAQADVPSLSGRLRSAIKVRTVSDGYEVYIDDGGMTEEEWSETYNGINQGPWGVAPYAARVESRKPYWRRVAMVIHDRLRRELNAEFKTNYNVRGEN